MSRLVSFWVLLGAIFLVVIFFFKVMASFLIPIFLASILCVMFGPLHKWILRKINGRQKISAALTTAIVVLLVLLPLALVVTLAILECREIMARLDANAISEKAGKIRTSLQLDIPFNKELQSIEDSLAELSGDIKSRDWHEKNLQLAQVESAAERFENQWQESVISKQGETAADSPAKKLLLEFRDQITNCQSQAKTLEAGELGADASLQAESDYREALMAANDLFRQFETELLGGRFWAAVKEFANPSPEEAEKYTSQVQSALTQRVFSFGGATTSFLGRLVVGACIMVISMYFFLLDGPAMIANFMHLSPLDDEYERELLNEFQIVSRAVVIATLLSAVVQGILAGFGYYVCGVGSVFLLMLLTTILAMVPFVGAAAVYVPASLWLYFVEGRPGWALVLLIYGAVIVSTADNIIKPLVLHGQSNLHPLLALLSVLGGVTAMGPIGILIGPMIVVFLQTLLKILNREMSKIDSETKTKEPAVAKAGSG